MRFWQRFARLNAPLISDFLREAADQVDRLWPGSPEWASPMFFTTSEGDKQMGEITVRDTSAPLKGTVTFLDAHEHETTPDDIPQWSSSDESVATVTADEAGLSAEVAIVGTPGAAVIEVRSTDTDGTEVVSQGTVTVQPGEAVIGSVEFEAPAEA